MFAFSSCLLGCLDTITKNELAAKENTNISFVLGNQANLNYFFGLPRDGLLLDRYGHPFMSFPASPHMRIVLPVDSVGPLATSTKNFTEKLMSSGLHFGQAMEGIPDEVFTTNSLTLTSIKELPIVRAWETQLTGHVMSRKFQFSEAFLREMADAEAAFNDSPYLSDALNPLKFSQKPLEMSELREEFRPYFTTSDILQMSVQASDLRIEQDRIASGSGIPRHMEVALSELRNENLPWQKTENGSWESNDVYSFQANEEQNLKISGLAMNSTEHKHWNTFTHSLEIFNFTNSQEKMDVQFSQLFCVVPDTGYGPQLDYLLAYRHIPEVFYIGKIGIVAAMCFQAGWDYCTSNISKMSQVFGDFTLDLDPDGNKASFIRNGKKLSFLDPKIDESLGRLVGMDCKGEDGFGYNPKRGHIYLRQRYSPSLGLTFALWSAYIDGILSHKELDGKVSLPEKATDEVLNLMEMYQFTPNTTHRKWLESIFTLFTVSVELMLPKKRKTTTKKKKDDEGRPKKRVAKKGNVEKEISSPKNEDGIPEDTANEERRHEKSLSQLSKEISERSPEQQSRKTTKGKERKRKGEERSKKQPVSKTE